MGHDAEVLMLGEDEEGEKRQWLEKLGWWRGNLANKLLENEVGREVEKVGSTKGREYNFPLQ